MASLNITDSLYKITKKVVVINYTTDVILDNVQLSKDGTNFIDATSFSQVSALFNISSWENGTYDNCVLRATYENAKILIGVTEIVMDEGETRTFGISLSKKIANDAVINIENSDTSVATVDKTSLTFTPDNYDKIQNIKVVGVHNPDDVNKIANITLSNANMTNKEVSIYVNNIDIYRGEIVLSTTNVSVNENGTATFTVKLDRKPTNNQIVNLSCENGNATLNKSSLTFTPSNYNVAQTVTVTGVYDNSLNDKSCVVVLTSNKVKTQSVNVAIKNIDHFGNIVLNKTSVSIDEGNTTTFTVKLDSKPSENQIVNISCNNSYATIDKASLTFTPSNYNKTQTVTISSVHNESDYVDRTIIITLSSPNVENKTITVIVNNIDVSPEVFGDIITSTNTLSVNENNSVAFTVKLNQAPTNNQIINISCNNSYATIDKASLTFTPSNYNTTQTVTVSGVHDTNSFDDKTCTITLSSNGTTDKTVVVTIINIDRENIQLVNGGIRNNGTFYDSKTYVRSELIDISSYNIIRIKCDSINQMISQVAFYDANRTFLSFVMPSSPECDLLITLNAKYVAFSVYQPGQALEPSTVVANIKDANDVTEGIIVPTIQGYANQDGSTPSFTTSSYYVRSDYIDILSYPRVLIQCNDSYKIIDDVLVYDSEKLYVVGINPDTQRYELVRLEGDNYMIFNITKTKTENLFPADTKITISITH